MIARFQAGGARVLVAGMRLPPNYGDGYAEDFHRLYAEVARARHAKLMPFFLDGVGAVPRLNQADGIHPTAEGYAIVVDRLWPYLVPLLQR
jgi:acyl-CoA thioesterase-1